MSRGATADQLRQTAIFDGGWYSSTYRDVVLLGMDPAEHFLAYGLPLRRDPGPDFSTSFYLDTHKGTARNRPDQIRRLLEELGTGAALKPVPSLVLWAAARVAERGDDTLAVQLAERHVPAEIAYSVAVSRANAARRRRGEAGWLVHVNGYLAHFGNAALRLHGEGTIFSRLSTDPLPTMTGGPLVSILMPAWNATATVRVAAQSILNQTWRNLELIIVDDSSVDGTWAVLEEIAAADKRVKIFRNKVNVGPYVSKNIALNQAKGEWITGHDADDWAHPQRIEHHLREVLASSGAIPASLTYMVRMHTDGTFSRIGKIGSFCFDGVARVASISCLFEANVLRERLGYWDSVRFGADSEMIARAQTVLGDGFRELRQVGMICLDLEMSLTNHAEHGVDRTKGISPVRVAYRGSWREWHATNLPGSLAYLGFPQTERRYDAADSMIVDLEAVRSNLP